MTLQMCRYDLTTALNAITHKALQSLMQHGRVQEAVRPSKACTGGCMQASGGLGHLVNEAYESCELADAPQISAM